MGTEYRHDNHTMQKGWQKKVDEWFAPSHSQQTLPLENTCTCQATGYGGRIGRVETIRRNGGEITSRDLSRIGPSRFQDKAGAESALNELIQAGLARWEAVSTTKKGGRPTRKCVLAKSET
jgi:hypothetical protein